MKINRISMDRRSRTVPGYSKKINVNEVADTILGVDKASGKDYTASVIVETDPIDPDKIRAVPKKKSTKKKK